MKEFDLARYSYPLDKKHIAEKPLPSRDGAKMLVIGSDGQLQDKRILDLPSFLRQGDIVVVNNTKVMPARLFGSKQQIDEDRDFKSQQEGTQNETGGKRKDKPEDKVGGKIEVLITKIITDTQAEAIIRASRPPLPDTKIIIDAEKQVYLKVLKVTKETDIPTYLISCAGNTSISSICEVCEAYGSMPLPPYIKRPAEHWDKERYQTIYAKDTGLTGSAAAPTAGLHLSNQLLETMDEKDIEILEVSLHVGLGTFAPIRTQDIRKHKMHAEYCVMPEEVSQRLNHLKDKVKNQVGNHAKGNRCKDTKNTGRIVAVGTTSLRVLETFYDAKANKFSAGSKETSVFIYPRGDENKPRAADILLTNFHQPASSLLLLVCAFSDYQIMMNAYKHALSNDYRFLSYGDACLIHRP